MEDELLILESSNIVLIHTVNLKLEKEINKNVWNQLRSVFPNIEVLDFEKNDYTKLFLEAEKQVIRLKLGSLKAQIYRYEDTQKKYEYTINVFLGYFPKYSVGTIMYKIDLGDINVDHLIYIRQSLMDKDHGFFDVEVDEVTKISNLKKCECLTSATKNILEGFLKQLNPRNEQEDSFFISSSVECNNIRGNLIKDISSSDFVEKYKYAIYGISCTDGGYRFASEDAVDKLVKNQWSTRKYFIVFASDLGTFSIYNQSGEIYNDYRKSNDEISELLRGNSYVSSFDLSRIKELDGLALYPCEKASIMKSLVLKNIFKDLLQDGKWNNNQRLIMNERKNILEILNQITYGNMQEITNLYNIILKSFDIMEYVDKVRDRLNLAHEDATLNAQKINNTLILILTFIGLILTIISLDFVKDFIF